MTIPPPQGPEKQQFHPSQLGQQSNPHQGQQVNPYQGEQVNPGQLEQQFTHETAEQLIQKVGILAGSFEATPDGFTASWRTWQRWALPLFWLLLGVAVGLGGDPWEPTFALAMLIVSLPPLLLVWVPVMRGRLTVSAEGITVRAWGTKQWQWGQLQQLVITGTGIRTVVRLRGVDGRHLALLPAWAWGWVPLEELARRTQAVRAQANSAAQCRALEAQYPGSTTWGERHPRWSGLLWVVVRLLGLIVVIAGAIVVAQLLGR